MADASIFRQFLQPVRSVQDYAADMDQADLRQVALEGARRQNALQALTVRQQMDDRNALQRAAAGWGADTTPDQRIASLRNSGNPTLMGQADALEKQWIDRRKAEADVGKISTETSASKFKLDQDKQKAAITQAASFASPADAIEQMNQAVQRGELRPEMANLLQRSMPQDPAKFDGWKLQMVLGLNDPEKMVAMLKPHLQTINTGGAQVNQAVNQLTGVPVETGRTAITQSADNKATVGASLANAAALREAAKLQADATRAAANTKRDQDTEMKLADDYRAQSKEFAQAKSAHEQLTATLGSATTSPAATLAAATKFMKILDPGSVVRESELGMALAASGVIDRATNYISTLQSGQKLTPTQAADFKKISNDMFQAAQRVQQTIDKDYQGKAKAYGLRPEMVTQDLGQNANVVSWGDLK